jgi:demethylmenaquinone methyltransferase/2-methoxy-6-polyprenyl-1,4-benzoquinol methylase
MFDHFGILAPIYDRVIRPGDARQLIQRIGLPVDGSLLDAGGGTGRVAQALHGLASQVLVADESVPMLKQAQAKNGLNTLCGRTEILPFADETFARVIMVDALHHVADQRQSIQEMWRVLKGGGRIVIGEPDIRQLAIKFIALAEKLALMRSHFLAPRKIAALFPDTAQIRIEIEDHNAWVIVEKPAAN